MNRFSEVRLKPDPTWTTCVISAALMIALAGTLTLHAQSGAAAGAKPAPRIDGHPDLNGTWDTGYNEIVIGFVRPQQLGGGSVCVSGCAPAAGAPDGRPGNCSRAASEVPCTDDSCGGPART